MRDLSGPRTLVVVGNVQRYPVHHPMAEAAIFRGGDGGDFIRREVPTTGLPGFQANGGGSCVVHLFRRRPESIERARGEPAGDEGGGSRAQARGKEKKKSGEGKEKKKKKKKKKK